MPRRENNEETAGDARAQPHAALNVIVNPEETIGLLLNPTFVSLGLTTDLFKKEVGGAAAE